MTRKIKLGKVFGQTYLDLQESDDDVDIEVTQLLDLAILLIQNIPSLRQLPRVLKHQDKSYYAMYIGGEYLYMLFYQNEDGTVIITKVMTNKNKMWEHFTPF
ncbi:MAG: hypothetical protein ACE5GR_05635 [Nitrosopumilus sp.]